MQPLRIMTLDLRSPLRYRLSTCTDPFVAPAEGERIARFDLDPTVAASVDADPASYLGVPALIADTLDPDTGGDTAPGDGASGDMVGATDGAAIAIPAAKYLFAQMRVGEAGAVDAELFAAAAIEVQRDGLWRGIALERFVYLRLLAEEAGPVFQILRPIAAGARA
jgi:hypothetical protein